MHQLAWGAASAPSFDDPAIGIHTNLPLGGPFSAHDGAAAEVGLDIDAMKRHSAYDARRAVTFSAEICHFIFIARFCDAR
jgi:hypothetical protein